VPQLFRAIEETADVAQLASRQAQLLH
jgi:hypothetical protein